MNAQAIEILKKMPVEFSKQFTAISAASSEMWLNGIPVSTLNSTEFRDIMVALDQMGEEKGTEILAALVTLVTASNHL